MLIPNGIAARRAVMEQYIAEAEQKGQRAFRPEQWDFESDFIEWRIATLQGCACTYSVWQLVDNTFLVSVRADGPWPVASIDWLWRPEPLPDYTVALALILRDIVCDSGGTEIQLGELAFKLAQG